MICARSLGKRRPRRQAVCGVRSMSNQDEIEQACERIITRMAHYMDHGQYEALSRLFTEDGEFNRRGMSSRGRKEIFDSVSLRPVNVITRHFCSAPCFETVTDSEATAVTYVVMYQSDRNENGPAKLAAPAVIAEYYDTFRRSSEGWRLAKRTIKPIMLPES